MVFCPFQHSWVLISPLPVASTRRRLTVTFQPRVPLICPCRWRCIQVPLEKSRGGPAGGLSSPCCQRDIWRDLTCILLFSLLSRQANSGSGADDSLRRDCGQSQSAAQREVEGSVRRERGLPRHGCARWKRLALDTMRLFTTSWMEKSLSLLLVGLSVKEKMKR